MKLTGSIIGDNYFRHEHINLGPVSSLQFDKFLTQRSGEGTFSQFESWNTHIRNRAHQNRTKRFHSIPADLSMPWVHTRLSLIGYDCVSVQPLIWGGFHLQNPPFFCMLMCLCAQWQQGCTRRSMCAALWITVHRCMNVWELISNCAHPPAPMAHWFLLIILFFSSVENTADTILFLVFLAHPSPSCFPPPLFTPCIFNFLLSGCSITDNFSWCISLSCTNTGNVPCCEQWSQNRFVLENAMKLRKNRRL